MMQFQERAKSFMDPESMAGGIPCRVLWQQRDRIPDQSFPNVER